MTDEPDTLRPCDACGGRMPEECGWCRNGFMDSGQFKRWRKFRAQARKASSTYLLLQSLMEDMIENLAKAGDEKAAGTGRRLLEAWKASESPEDRASASRDLWEFHRRAVDALRGVKG